MFLNVLNKAQDFNRLYTPPHLTLNVEPFKNRAFKSNDVSPGRHQSRQRKAPTRHEGEEGKERRKKRFKGSPRKRKRREIVPLFRRWQSTPIAMAEAGGEGREGRETQRRRRVVRSRKGSICRHNFTGIACRECR